MRIERKRDEIIDSWRLLEPLGGGGNAEVWRAERADTTMVAALKILRQKKPTSEPYRRFRNEIAVLRALGSFPGILPLLDAKLPEKPTRDTPAWLAVPVAQSIREALASAPSLARVVEGLASIADTLARLAAEHHIFHRDIKPENLYLQNEVWCIGDFGLAHYPDGEALTSPGSWVGPKHYLAPEVFERPDDSDPGPVDAYALAKTLWVLATRQNFPLAGFLPRSVPQFQIGTYSRDERAALLDYLVERATSPDPRQRPTMRDIAEELAAWSAGPDLSRVEIPIAELRARIAPTMDRHRLARDQRDKCTEHVEQRIGEALQRLQPLASALQGITGLPTNLGFHGAVSNIREVYQYFQVSDYLSYRSAGCFAESPTPCGDGGNPISLHCGLIIQFTKQGELYISGAHAIYFGSKRYETLWAQTERCLYATAAEQRAFDIVLAALHHQLHSAVLTFSERLRDVGLV